MKIFSKYEYILLIGSFIISLLLTEIGAIIWLKYFAEESQYRKYSLYTNVPETKFQWSKHHYLNYYPTPNYKRGLTNHNSLGFRGDEIVRTKQDDTYRIVVLGGSTTYTIEVDDDDSTFTKLLENELNKQIDNLKIEVINAGVGGYTTWESLLNLQLRILDLVPDLIIIYHGTNDVHSRLVTPEYYQSDNSGYRKQWQNPDINILERSTLLRIFLRKFGLTHQLNLGSVIRSDHFVGKQLDILSQEELIQILNQNKPIYFKRNIENMIAIARENQIAVLLSTWAHTPYFNDYASTLVYQIGFSEHNDVLRSIAIEKNIPLIDFAKYMSKDVNYWADGRHLNEKGVKLKTQYFFEYIMKKNMIGANHE